MEPFFSISVFSVKSIFYQQNSLYDESGVVCYQYGNMGEVVEV
jgi:hypothetical protein